MYRCRQMRINYLKIVLIYWPKILLSSLDSHKGYGLSNGQPVIGLIVHIMVWCRPLGHGGKHFDRRRNNATTYMAYIQIIADNLIYNTFFATCQFFANCVANKSHILTVLFRDLCYFQFENLIHVIIVQEKQAKSILNAIELNHKHTIRKIKIFVNHWN